MQVRKISGAVQHFGQIQN